MRSGGLNVTNSTFSGTLPDSEHSEAAALCIFQNSSAATISGSTFEGNSGNGLSCDTTGSLTVSNSTFSNNNTNTSGDTYSTGGLSLRFGALSVSASTFDNNRSHGLNVWQSSDPITIVNSTASNNLGIGFALSSDAVISSCTVTANDVGIANYEVANVRNSIIAHNGSANCNFGSSSVSQGYNIESADDCGFNATGDQPNTDPLLAPLGNYGGMTRTLAPCTEPGIPHASCTGASPALNAGNPASPGGSGAACPATDQRGVQRVYALCDVGSVEASPCGNGVIDGSEECDDGNFVQGDGCDNNCTVTRCGNNVVTSGEECDDGNNGNGDCCSATCHLELAGGSCTDDANPFTTDACNAMGACLHSTAPVANCTHDAPRQAKLLLRGANDPNKRQLEFKWNKGSFDGADLGAPATTTDYGLFVFNPTGLVGGLSVPSGTMCGSKPCWATKGTPTSAIKYSDHRKPAPNNGVTGISAKADISGKGKLEVKAQGSTLPPMTLGHGLLYPVTVQIITTDGACWEATFTAADENKNDASTFKATHVSP